MILSDQHWFIRFLGKHITLKKSVHCAWCGELFETRTKIGNTDPKFCSPAHNKASTEARRKRKGLAAKESAITQALPQGTTKRFYDPRFPVPEKDEVARECRVPVTRISLRVPVGATCHYCTRPATTKDHIVPKARGGSNYYWNLVPACASCNTNKAAKTTTCKCAFCERSKELHLLLPVKMV